MRHPIVVDGTVGRLEHVMAILGGDVVVHVANETHFAANSHFIGKVSRAFLDMRRVLNASN